MAPSGDPIHARLSRIDRRLDAHETRLDGHDAELRELNRDIGVLGDVILRSKVRARARMKSSKRRPRAR